MNTNYTTVELFAGKKTTGEPVFEEVLVIKISENNYKIAKSPGLVIGVAADDVIEVNPLGKGEYKIVKRGKNLCVQIFCDNVISKKTINKMVTGVQSVGGRLDGSDSKLLVFTIPLRNNFQQVENTLNNLLPGKNFRWYYGNVYDPVDGVTPLNWWNE